MKAKYFQKIIIVLTLFYSNIAIAGWLDDIKNIKDTATSILENSQKIVKEVIEPNIKNNKSEAEQPSSTSESHKNKKMLISNDEISVSGYIKRVSTGITKSGQKYIGVQVYLYNTESSSDIHINCLTYSLDKFVSDPSKKYNEYSEFESERVKLINVKETDINSKCTFSQLDYIGEEDYKENNVEGWVEFIMPDYYNRNAKWHLNKLVFTDNSLTGCKSFHREIELKKEESNNFNHLYGFKVRLSNVRYTGTSSCLFETFEVIERKTHHVSNQSKINDAKNISTFFGNINASYRENLQNNKHRIYVKNRRHPFYKVNKYTCKHILIQNPGNSKISINTDEITNTPVTLTNVTVNNGQCYFDEIMPNLQKTSVSNKEKIVKQHATDAGIILDYLSGLLSIYPKVEGIVRFKVFSSKGHNIVKDCTGPYGKKFSFRPNPNSIDNGLAELDLFVTNLVTITDVTVHKNGECYFDKIVLGVRKENNIVSSKQVKKTSVKASFKPDHSKKIKDEGDMLIGKLSLPVSIIPMQSTTTSGQIKSEFTVKFNLKDVLNPVSNPHICNSYIFSKTYPIKTSLKPLASQLKKQIRRKARIFLTKVRPANEEGLCLFDEITYLSKHESAHITQADVSITSVEQKNERDVEYKRCASSTRLNQHYQCGCYADKFLQARKLFPNRQSELISVILKNECINIAALSNNEYENCMKHKFIDKATNGGSRDKFCNCVASKFESLVVEHGFENSRKLLSTARAQCR